jgi:hypothetical protein
VPGVFGSLSTTAPLKGSGGNLIRIADTDPVDHRIEVESERTSSSGRSNGVLTAAATPFSRLMV